MWEPSPASPRRQASLSAAKGLGQTDIARLPSHPSGDPRAPPTMPQCLICLEDFAPGDALVYLPCNHHFHASCAGIWLAKKAECPMRCSGALQSGGGGTEAEALRWPEEDPAWFEV
uniref:RING-type domain-containing protein n=1 Tax=Alexandrium catenella TaxID=2925 RepID=A0A7S1PNY6_ALECA